VAELRGGRRALRWGVPRHWRNLLQLQACHKHGQRRDSAPAVEYPARAKEFDLRAQGDVENHFCGAAIELLRELEERALAELLGVRGTPDGNIEGFLLDLIGDGEGAKEGAGNGFRDVERRAVAAGFEAGAGGDERKFEWHERVPFPGPRQSLAQQKNGGLC